MNKAFLIVEGSDSRTAQWFYADAAWQALDQAGRDGFDETIGFRVVRTADADAVCIVGDGYNC